MTAIYGNDAPVNMTATAAEYYLQGSLVMVTTNAVTIITADESITVGVVDQKTVNAEQTARAVVASEKIGIWPLGCGRIVNVRSQDAQTYTVGMLVVNSDTVDGACAITVGSTGDNVIGTYMGDGEVTTADGDLIPVLLNVAPDTADHS